jgi:processive 1,2-diacylglycerol beta-glucosyltransferase
MKKVLICYTSIGSGHRVAAEAIRDALQTAENVEVKLVDAFEPLGVWGRVIADMGSLFSLALLPDLYSWAWNSLYLGQFFVKMPKLKRLKNYLLALHSDYNPDMIVCTHALPSAIFSREMEHNHLPTPLIVVNIEMDVHPYWPLHNVTQYMVGSWTACKHLLQWGVLPDRVSVIGVPMRAQFTAHLQPATEKTTETKQVLVLAGGKQAAPYARTWPHIVSLISRIVHLHNHHAQWTVITGNNRMLLRLLKWIAKDDPHITVTGYVENMAEVLACADVVLSKPSGLTVTECLALHKPMILLTRGGGQEAANANCLLVHEAAVFSGNAARTVELIEQMFDNGEAERMAQNAATLAYPHAAAQIATYLMNELGIPALSGGGGAKQTTVLCSRLHPSKQAAYTATQWTMPAGILERNIDGAYPRDDAQQLQHHP